MSAHSAAMREFRPILVELANQGWTVEKTTKGHLKAKPPHGGELVHFAPSSDSHSFKNALSHLRAGGFVWPPPPRSRERREEVREAVSAFVAGNPAPLEDLDKKIVAEYAKPVEETSDERAWRELRDARAYAVLAGAELSAATAAAEVARRTALEAREEYDSAVAFLRDAKAAFDAAFDVDHPFDLANLNGSAALSKSA